MIECPRCSAPLKQTGATFEFRCGSCGGCALNLGALRRRTGHRRLAAVTAHLVRLGSASIGCPLCRSGMTEHAFPCGGEEVHVEICETCAYLWFDAGELSKFEGSVVDAETSSALLRERILKADLPPVRIHRSPSLVGTDDGPLWQWLAGHLLGLPMETQQDARVFSLATWCIAAYLIVAFLLVNWARQISLHDFALVPANLWRYHGATLLTYIFLHADLAHLLGNLSFLLLVGDDVESDLGPVSFLILCIAAGVASGLAHAFFAPGPAIPLVGASGLVSGLLSYYGLRFAGRPLDLVIHPLLRQRARYPAGILLMAWIGLQIADVGSQLAGTTNVSAIGHLGGAAVGIVAWMSRRGRH